MTVPLWRVGRKLGRTIYYDDNCVGMLDNAGVARRVVDRLNAEAGSVDLAKWLREYAECGDGDDIDDRLRAAAALLEDQSARISSLQSAAGIADQVFRELDLHRDGQCPKGDVNECVDGLRALMRHYQAERRANGDKP